MKNIIVAIITAVSLVLTPMNVVFAQAPGGVFKDVSQVCWSEGNCTVCDMLTVMVTIANGILSILAILATVFFVWGAGWMMLSAGNSTMVEKGKSIMKATVLGTIVTLIAWQLMATVVVIVINRSLKPPQGSELNMVTGWFNVANTCKSVEGSNASGTK